MHTQHTLPISSEVDKTKLATAGGITAAIIFGFIAALLAKPKMKQ